MPIQQVFCESYINQPHLSLIIVIMQNAFPNAKRIFCPQRSL